MVIVTYGGRWGGPKVHGAERVYVRPGVRGHWKPWCRDRVHGQDVEAGLDPTCRKCDPGLSEKEYARRQTLLEDWLVRNR